MEIIFNVGRTDVMLRSNVGKGLAPVQYELCRLKKRKNRQTKEEETVWTAFQWYGSLVGGLTGVLELKLALSDARGFREVKEKIDDLRREIRERYETEIGGKDLPR